MTSLFLLYVNDLCNVSTRLTSILFADNTSCFIEDIDLSDMRIQLSTEVNKRGLRQTGNISQCIKNKLHDIWLSKSI